MLAKTNSLRAPLRAKEGIEMNTKTIVVNRNKLINVITQAFKYAGSNEWFVCVDPDGTPDIYTNSHESYKNAFVLLNCEHLYFEDAAGNYPDSSDYKTNECALWVVDEMDLNLEHEAVYVQNGEPVFMNVKIEIEGA
jgi:hypothetical protein